ncbi:hypothetical protein AMTRI_Chr10g226170 [Amborella trichopoda]
MNYDPPSLSLSLTLLSLFLVTFSCSSSRLSKQQMASSQRGPFGICKSSKTQRLAMDKNPKNRLVRVRVSLQGLVPLK